MKHEFILNNVDSFLLVEVQNPWLQGLPAFTVAQQPYKFSSCVPRKYFGGFECVHLDSSGSKLAL